MTCKGLSACPRGLACLHRALVKGYHEERERQEMEWEYQTEREREEYDVVTFKEWLIANRGDGRHRPPSKTALSRSVTDDDVVAGPADDHVPFAVPA